MKAFALLFVLCAFLVPASISAEASDKSLFVCVASGSKDRGLLLLQTGSSRFVDAPEGKRARATVRDEPFVLSVHQSLIPLNDLTLEGLGPAEARFEGNATRLGKTVKFEARIEPDLYLLFNLVSLEGVLILPGENEAQLKCRVLR